jgi:hypothetical protein
MKSRQRSLLSSPVVWAVFLSLLWAIIFALDLIPYLRGGTDWAWNYKPELARYRIAPLILGVVVYMSVALWLRKQRSGTGLLIWAILGGIALSLAAVHARGDLLYRLYTITVSGRAAGWHMAAARIHDLPATLRDWPLFMQESLSFSPHIDHSPPGIVIAYYFAGIFLDQLPTVAAYLARPLRWLLCQYLTGYTNGQYASAWLGMLMPLWGSLTVVPLSSFGRRVFGHEAARWSVVWWPLVPSFLMFDPLPNTVYALPSLLVIGLLWEGLSGNRIVQIVAAGALMSILTFLTFTFAPLLLFAGLLTLGAYWMRTGRTSGPRPRWYWPFQMGLWFLLGLSAVWLIFYATTGASFWGIWQTAQQTQTDIAQVRPYGPWLALDLNDFFMFTGWPLALLAAVACWSAIRNLRSKGGPTESDVMILAAALTLVVVDLYGTPRGEWGRILLFLAPWLLLAAASRLHEAQTAGGILTAAQGIMAIVMIASLQVLAPEFRAHAAPVPPAVKSAASNPPLTSSGAIFAEDVRLAAVSGKFDTQPDVDGKERAFLYLWLTWDTLRSMNAPYEYVVQPISPDGLQGDRQVISSSPVLNSYPTTCWRPSDGSLTDRIKVPLPRIEDGDWSVDFAIIDPSTGQLLNVMTQDGARGQQLRLGPFH